MKLSIEITMRNDQMFEAVAALVFIANDIIKSGVAGTSRPQIKEGDDWLAKWEIRGDR